MTDVKVTELDEITSMPDGYFLLASDATAGSVKISWSNAKESIPSANYVSGPATNTDLKIPQWSGTDTKTLKDGLALVTELSVPGADTNVPTEQAVVEFLTASAGNLMLGTNNLSEITDPGDARSNLWLGTASVEDSTAFAAASHEHVVADITDFPTVGTGDVIGPATNTADYAPQWSTANSKTLVDGYPITAAGKAILDDADAAAQRATLGLDKVQIGLSWPAKPSDAAVISLWPPACTLPTNLTGALYHAVVDPAAEAVVSLSKNGAAAFGTLTVAAGSTDVVTPASSETSFNGTTDRLDITFPAQDADWSGVSFKIQGVRA